MPPGRLRGLLLADRSRRDATLKRPADRPDATPRSSFILQSQTGRGRQSEGWGFSRWRVDYATDSTHRPIGSLPSLTAACYPTRGQGATGPTGSGRARNLNRRRGGLYASKGTRLALVDVVAGCYEVNVPRHTNSNQLGLFAPGTKTHLRFHSALDSLDLAAAADLAPPDLQPIVLELNAAVEQALATGRDGIELLVRSRSPEWPPAMVRAWGRLVAAAMQREQVAACADGRLRAEFLQIAGDLEQAHEAIAKHLQMHPRDTRGWRVLAAFEPVRGWSRCGFHGGLIGVEIADFVSAAEDDELPSPSRWAIVYAWFAHALPLTEIDAAVAAETATTRPPTPHPGDAVGFAWYLLAARGLRVATPSTVSAAFQEISETAFSRYRDRIGA